jgi:glucose/arabinose dehydrogenase
VRNFILAMLVLVGALGTPALALGSALMPTGFRETLVAEGLDGGSGLQFAPDGRLFVSEQSGELWLVDIHTGQRSLFLRVEVNADGERGLIGFTFDPDFGTNGYLYVHYVSPGPPIHSRISRFESAGDGARAGSETIIFELEPQETYYHVGGALAFGPDGLLYVGVGDNAQVDHSQALDTTGAGEAAKIAPEALVRWKTSFVRVFTFSF